MNIISILKSISWVFLVTFFSVNAVGQTEGQIQLKVALYPYLPDSCKNSYSSLQDRIEGEFEALYPDIDLVLRPLNSTGSFYNFTYLEELLNEYDILETDSIYLDQLLQNKLLSPWPENPCDKNWQKIPQEICNANLPYAWPHWQCGYFLFGQKEDLQNITSLETFEAALKAIPAIKIPLIVNFYDKINLADVYIDAYTDQNPEALQNFSENNATIKALQTLAAYTCTPKNKKPSTTGFYNNHAKASAALFAANKAVYYIGYAEDYALIHPILQNETQSIHALHAPWGPYHQPTIALDSLVLSKKNTLKTRLAAILFAKYLTDPSTYQWIVLGEDCAEKPQGRYLLPASETAYTHSQIGENPMMLDYYHVIQNGSNPMPWKYFSIINSMIGAQVYDILNNTISCADS